MAAQRRQGAVLLALLLCLAAGGAGATPAAFYEIFPASFYDSDGDGMGDLAGIEAKIGYLSELGVGGVWLMPIHPSPSYHKYDVVDYYAVDPGYGTVGSLVSLAEALHAADMALLMDLVLNHTSSRHPWFLSATESLAVEPCGETVCTQTPLCREHNPYVSYYHFSPESTPGWHAVPGADGWWYMGGFTHEMPDLDLSNTAVTAEIDAICAYWMALGVDGFRLDAVSSYFEGNAAANNAFVSGLMERLRATYPDVYVVGELWSDAGTIANAYESGISSLFNFPFSGAEGAIVKAIRSGGGASFARKAAQWQALWSDHPDASDAPFLSNHDQARIAGTLMRKPESLKMAASMYLSLPGTPFVYYGEELGMTGSGRDENKRLPMLWTETGAPGYCDPPAAADQEASFLGSAGVLLAQEDSLLRHYQALLRLRQEHSALRNGEIAVLETEFPALCAYTLTNDEETVLVLHNLGEEEILYPFAKKEYVIPAMSSYVADTLLTP